MHPALPATPATGGFPSPSAGAAYAIAIAPPAEYVRYLESLSPRPFIVSWRWNHREYADVNVDESASPLTPVSWMPRGAPAYLEFGRALSEAAIKGQTQHQAYLRQIVSGPDIPRAIKPQVQPSITPASALPLPTEAVITPPPANPPAGPNQPIHATLKPTAREKRVLRWLPVVKAWAERYKANVPEILAIIDNETAGDPNLESPQGAFGLMQVMPATFKAMGVGSDIKDPGLNIAAGIKYYVEYCLPAARAVGATGTDALPLALAAYNGGHARLKQRKTLSRMPPESRAYAKDGVTKVARYTLLTE